MRAKLVAYFASRGIPALDAEIWANMIETYAAVLAQAEAAVKVPANWAAFIAKDGALGSVRKSGRHKGKRLPQENAISSELRIHLNELMGRLPSSSFIKKFGVHLHLQMPIPSKKKAGSEERRADLSFVPGWDVDIPEFQVEAKPVCVLSDLKKRYLGAEGLGCFTGDEPYTNERIAGLLAYSIDSGHKCWWASLEAEVKSGAGLAWGESNGSSAKVAHSEHSRVLPDHIHVMHFQMHFTPV